MSCSKICPLYQENLKVKVIIFNHTEFLKPLNERNSASKHNLSIRRPVELGEKFEECFRKLLSDHAEIQHVKDHDELTAKKVLDLMQEGLIC